MLSPVTPRGSMAEASLRRLDPRVVTYWRLALLAEVLAASAGVWLVAPFVERWFSIGWLAPLVALLGLGLVIGWPPARFQAWGFELRREDLLVRRGVLVRTTSIIPHRRIQHVDTRRDPLERWFGLARVVLYTAGIRGAEITIPGLAVKEAEALRDRLAELGGTDAGI
jgi:membrane protein YdbS with pleckstrin-like domain